MLELKKVKMNHLWMNLDTQETIELPNAPALGEESKIHRLESEAGVVAIKYIGPKTESKVKAS